ncbi:type II secretion system F family protein [Nocardioides campestrisoli]|uniref:type II secretion system F family protein n=1 Tax=Nocardioides campestrisoli TaxID=2736757 RepID=UPI00163D96C2|nr:type II secretion system F family protein [Nocardioides campestrisoli]
MSPALTGALLGLLVAVGLQVVLARVVAIRRTQVSVRVLPYVRDLPQVGRAAPLQATAVASPLGAAQQIFGPALRRAADLVERVLGGGASVARRLERADLEKTVHEFRVEQVVWGLLGFAGVAAWQLLDAVTGSASLLGSALLCLVGFAGGVVLRDQRLTASAVAREREIVAEFPIIAELLALAVASGESPVAALDRVVRRSSGALSVDLGRVLASIRTGEPVAVAFHELARRTGLSLVARFAQGVSVAVDRGTPLADVLHAQAADVREAGRRALIESAARREVFMLVPVVFLVLPVTVLFAFYPGLVGLRLTTP